MHYCAFLCFMLTQPVSGCLNPATSSSNADVVGVMQGSCSMMACAVQPSEENSSVSQRVEMIDALPYQRSSGASVRLIGPGWLSDKQVDYECVQSLSSLTGLPIRSDSQSRL